MAENVKRRVAAARLAVAFAAAATIAGATAWAQAGPPAPTAQSSAFDAFLKLKLDSSNIKNNSLLFKDFIKGEVPSGKQFKKLEASTTQFKKATNKSISSIKGELGDIKLQVDGIKGELGSYIKGEAADARYIKLTDAVVRGDGSVFTASQLVNPNAQTFTPLLAAPGMLSIDVMGQMIRITNTSGGALGHSECVSDQGGGNVPAGTLANGQSIQCFADTSTESIQFFSWGELGASATVSFSSVTDQQLGTQNTVQILIGL